MAQFSVNRKSHYLSSNRDLHEVVMIADKDGNINSGGGALTNINLAGGLIEGYSSINKFGYNEDLGNNGFESIWDGSSVYSYPASPEPCVVASANGPQTGAVVEIQGLDAGYNLIVESVPVGASSSASFIRIFRAILTTPPVGEETNTADINLLINGSIAATILDGAGQTLMAIYTIPAGKTGYLTKLFCSVDKSTDVVFRLMARPEGGAFNVKGQFGTFGVPLTYEYTVPLVFTEKTDIEIRAQSGNTCGAGAIFDIILVDNDG